jgi:hypothetical protein
MTSGTTAFHENGDAVKTPLKSVSNRCIRILSFPATVLVRANKVPHAHCAPATPSTQVKYMAQCSQPTPHKPSASVRNASQQVSGGGKWWEMRGGLSNVHRGMTNGCRSGRIDRSGCFSHVACCFAENVVVECPGQKNQRPGWKKAKS